MDKFDNITGFVGENDYKECHSQKINVDSLLEKDIDTLETMGYTKHYGYKNKGSWHNALNYKTGKIDLIEKEKKEKEGYVLKKEMHKSSFVPINSCQWIDDLVIIDDCTIKNISFYFVIDRFSTLGYQKQILEQDTFITYRDILQFVDSFYNGVFTMDELKLVKDTDDCFKYCDKAKDAYINDTKLKRKEVMGDCVYFEGFREYDEGYRLKLGS